MAQQVTVSLIHPMFYREDKGEDYIRYPAGSVSMPLAHAQALGVAHRIVSVEEGGDGEKVVKRLAFNGSFDERLTQRLLDAGFATLDDLRKASRDQLLSIEGIGPGSYEAIHRATHGGGS